MIRMICLLFLICLAVHGETVRLSSSCNYYDSPVTKDVTLYSYQSNSEAEQIIGAIIDVIGLKPNFVVRPGDVDNAAAVILRGKRYILYNPQFIEAIDRRTNNRWAAISILAHETGHHLNGHTLLNSGSRPDIELEADEFSGFVLRKLGASVKDAQAAMAIAADIRGSHTHPPRSKRLTAIQTGWQNADRQMKGLPLPEAEKMTTQIKKEKVPVPKQSEILAGKYIAFTVKFNTDPKGEYYVTIKNHLVKISDTNLVVLANMVASSSKNFPYVLYQGKSNYLFVKRNGLIVNSGGAVAGYMRPYKK